MTTARFCRVSTFCARAMTGEVISTVPGVTPGGEILLRLDGWPRVKRALDAIADIEARGIDPAAVAPDWWRHLHNRIICNVSHRAYTRSSACGMAAPSQMSWDDAERLVLRPHRAWRCTRDCLFAG